MRRCLLAAAIALLAAGCGGGGKSTPASRSTGPTDAATVTTAPATTPSATTTTPSSAYRTPAPGERQTTVTGNVADGRTRRLPGTGDTANYTYFVLQPEDGSAPLRVAAAGDLDIDPQVRAAILDARCGGRLRGTFTVVAAPARETAFDWELVTARLLNTCNRA